MKIFPDAAGMRKRGIITLILAVVLFSAWYFLTLPSPEDVVHNYWEAVANGQRDLDKYFTDGNTHSWQIIPNDLNKIQRNGGLDSVSIRSKKEYNNDTTINVAVELKYKNGRREHDGKYLSKEWGGWKIVTNGSPWN